jgi:hypothetical protein
MTDFGRVVQDAFHKQRLDQARGLHQLMKNQMTTGDVPTTVDGPASGRKRKKKGPGDCGPNGAHVAKTKVAGYTRVVNGKVVHVSGYVTGGHAAIDAMASDDILRRAGNPRNKTFNFTSRNDPPRGAGMGPNFQTDAEFGRDRPKKPNPGRKSNLERIIAESKDKDQVAAATAELERKYGRVRRPARDKPAASGGSKFTSVKPGEEKVIDGVTIRRSKAIGRMGSTYTLSTPHIGQVVYGRKQGQAKAEHEYLVAHDGGAKKDPKYTWQAGYEIGDVLEDGSVVKAFWRNELIVKRPDGSKGSHSALSTLPKKKSKPDAKQPKGVKDESKNPDFKPDLSGMVEGDPDGPGDGPFELTDTAVKDPSKSDEFADILEDYGADIRSKIDSVANENGGLRGVADGANGSVVVWTKSGVFRIAP